MSNEDSAFNHCLYFTANSLCRIITRMAEETFAGTGLCPSYAFVLMKVEQDPGIMLTDLAGALNLAPSTITRFVDKLEQQDLLERRSEGRTVRLHLTERGQALHPDIITAWEALYERYKSALGEENAHDLTCAIHNAVTQLENTR